MAISNDRIMSLKCLVGAVVMFFIGWLADVSCQYSISMGSTPGVLYWATACGMWLMWFWSAMYIIFSLVLWLPDITQQLEGE